MVAQHYLTNGELPGETNPTLVFYSTIRVDWYRWWQRGRIGASSSLAMAGQRRCVEVHQSLWARARPGKKHIGSMVTT